VLVFNKLDLVPDEDVVAGLTARHPDALLVSAKTGAGLAALRSLVWERAAEHAAGRRSTAGTRAAGTLD
jgi:50S ribosomal subunit-associated GTPase HflX